MNQERELRQLMCDIGRRVWDRGMVAANDGNFSVKISENEILCPTFRTLEPSEKIVFAQQEFVRISRTVLYPNIGGRISAGLSQTPGRS